MEDCVFCKILNKEIPSEFLYEDDVCVAFRDINPKADTHILIVPRKHIPTIIDMEEGDEKIIGHLVACAKKLGVQLNLPGYHLQINVGKEGGQEVFHVHMHMMANFA
ncbi:MAG: histidine triad nucleotide-binding protein [Candidatus Gracilibacteria bacterium]